MIKIEEKNDGKYLQLTGHSSHVMVFYTFWQTKLWPDWMNHTGIGNKNDYAHKQHVGVINALSVSDPILLANDQKVYKDAYKFALEQCSKLGIKFQIYEMRLQMIFEN